MDSIQVRKVQHNDLDTIHNIARASAKNSLSQKKLVKNGFLTGYESREIYARLIDSTEHFYVLETNQHIIGFLFALKEEELDSNYSINQKIKTFASNSFVVIQQVCIEASYRKKGYAKLLYEKLMSKISDDIFAVADIEPYNNPAIQLHNALGFKQKFEVVTERDKKGVFFWNNPANNPHYDKEVIMTQYEFAVSLYEHEDKLNWSKVHNFLYVSAGLFGVISIVANADSNYSNAFFAMLLTLSILGIIVSLMFFVTIHNGIKYLQKRKKTIVEIEEILERLGGINIVAVKFNPFDKAFKASPTGQVMRAFPLLVFMIWLIILIISFIYI
ncbi:GNAT family N-acetyltransferase [Gracilibacillus sp. YIM 98692]|uniref:GNAT family N-acetyltransferase n=1 Tax=Gracilibacillus sp. YIM 98692 TaxID=2663532 RepID=UPI0013D8DDFF|nr:GNAT family N-acetyltransferase [Gracilibacillus sp. YIM 98692]